MADFRTHTLTDAALDPLTAFARLRHHVPNLPSFLLESRAPDSAEGRYSIVGYRALGAEAMPPNVDVLHALAESHGGREPVGSLPEQLAQSGFGFFMFEVAHVRHRVRPVGNQVLGGVALLHATVAVFDHPAGTITIAGRAAGKAVERCTWELTHGPEPEPTPTVDAGARPEGLAGVLPDDRFQAKITRAKQSLFGDLADLVLARGFAVPRGDTDALDAYRALRARSRAPFLFYFHIPASPAMGELQLFGGSEHALSRRRMGGADEGSLVDEVHPLLPHPALTGSRPLDAMQVLRRVEDAPRELFGGAVGYFGPGGAGRLVLTQEAVLCFEGQYTFAVGVPVTPETDPPTALAASAEAAQPVLSAIHHAQVVARTKARPPAQAPGPDDA